MECFSVRGTHFDIGEALGRIARPLAGHIAATVERDSSRMRTADMPALLARMQEHFPQHWDELRGMSTAMRLDIEDVFLWNWLQEQACDAANASVVVNRLGYRLILNKRVVGPSLAPRCRIVEAHPEGTPGFLGLHVPGCLPGTAFGASHAGVAHVADPIPQETPGNGLPGFVISRAVLDAGSLAEALDIVMACERIGSGHHILASTQEFVTVAVTASPEERKLAPIPNTYWTAKASRRTDAALGELMSHLPRHPAEEDMLSLLEPGADASVISPAEGNIGTALIKLTAGRIDLRLFRAEGVHRYTVKVRH